MRDSIFKKKQEINKTKISESSDSDEEIKISKNEILKSIPKKALNDENIVLKTTMKEWRWRIFKIPIDNNFKDFIEISYHDPSTQKRFYVNKNKKWISCDISLKYDKYLIKKYYYYSSS